MAPRNHEFQSKDIDEVIDFLSTLPVLGLCADAADVFGAIKAKLERRGQRLADADLMIAAVALSHDATVITGNLKHFERIDGLEAESWIPR